MKYIQCLTIILIGSTYWSQISAGNEGCVTQQCFHQGEDACPPRGSACRCQQLPTCNKTVVCCNVDEFQLKEGLGCAGVTTDGFVEALHVRNATLSALNLSLASWKRLRSMTITDGRIGRIIGEFAVHSTASCLNLSSNGISKFERRSLVKLYNLSYLDLSHNNLTEVPSFKIDRNITLDISDNSYLQCSSVMDVLKRREVHFKNDNNTNCSWPKTFQWFNSTAHVPLSQVIRINELAKDCPKNCNCEPQRLLFVPGKAPTFAVAVNCTRLGLTSLPTPLPMYTFSLNVSNNNITSLEPLNTDPTYRDLQILYADNNQISSIIPLEGSRFLSNFVILSLKNNKIKSIPIYILSNIFDRNYNTRQIGLGENQLNCDCNTARVFKVWLLTKQKQIIDYDEIYCDNMDVRVSELNQSKLCQSKQDWTDYIYYIITLEVVMLVVLITKVSYDYWVFKTAGYLPWPASKMPKLPCDWLCE